MKDYYQILNINETSTKDEIKSSYRKLSKQFHPDVNPDGADKFKEIAEAYDVLSNDEKRQKYDLERKNPFGNMSNGFGDMFDIFNSFGGQQRKQQRAPDKVLNVNITPQESLLGIKKNVTYQRKEHCGICNGSGGDKVACTTCTGHGVIQQRFNLGGQTFVQNMTCPNCHGGGFKISNPCYNCNGNGFKVNLNTINLDIPKSVDNGDFLRVGGSGDYQSNIGYGDLVLQIRMADDGLFQKIGNNLHTSIKLSIEDIFIKDDIHLEHPEGEIKIKFPDRIDTSRPVRIKTKGFLTQEGKGDFIIKFDLDTNKGVITNDKIEKIVEILKQ